MPHIYSSIIHRIFGSTGPGMLRQVGPNMERAVWRQTLFSRPQQSRFFSASRITTYAKPRPTISNTLSNFYNASLRSTRRSFHRTSRLRDAKSPPKSPAAQEPQGITARLRKLSREYGWAALGVYLGLTVLDFPFCFLLVRSVGTERIGEIEHYIVSHISKLIPQSVRDWWNEYREALKSAKKERQDSGGVDEHDDAADWGVGEAEKRHKAEASLGTQLALAYAIHKSFIFLRVPLTAAITPKVVKVLRSWGWKIGKRPNKP
ncbi:uncharacterized protein GGS22DRAFT_171524 [Annulohypoxylon maeteangense]|uniref:uncharacterized protein n=1 Tax=Annulohypoxylon maeteangense TaxID=1927788 RepID=UPI002007EE46|nr:uncharacterized protein GGS22DRAFT_171524 [Annulohypoxylon maeteangense]KAI0881648.1 hypothetical protein GGS22DRAFT_171524 [Annulohypoxylon maeteangense]